MKRRVVVTGLGVVTSLGQKVTELWPRVVDGQSGIHKVQLVDVSDHKIRIGGDVIGWEPTDYIAAKDLKRIDRFTQFALVAAADAIQDAGLDFANEDPYRCGAILGTGIGGIGEIEVQMHRLFFKGPDRVSALTVPKMMANAAGGVLSIEYGLRGPNYTVSTACASATNAIGDAMRVIQHGGADVIVTGGTETAMTRMGIAAFQNIKALSSSHNDSPEAASRPFDLNRDGFVLSEGCGILVLEELEHARARQAEIYAEVFGYGVSTDAGHITQPNEEGEAAAYAMQAAVRDAELNPEQLDYINAHGTSTPLGDKAETLAIKRVFGGHAYELSISSTKSQLGHSLGASGGVEMVLSVKAVQEGVIPPTINLDTPDPDCDLDYTPNAARQRDVRYAMSNSFGFGGHNACVVLGRLR